MGAIGYTSGDPNKVNVTGDTMTGDLILSGAGTDLTVGGVLTDTYQGITGDMARFMATTLSTGITSGGTLAVNANPARIDIAATTGWIVDSNPFGTPGPVNPVLTYVTFPGATGVALTGPPTQALTFWLLTSTGTVVQQATGPTQTQYRTHLVLGYSVFVGGTIAEVASSAAVQGQLAPQLYDLMRRLSAFATGDRSNVITPNGANLRINTTGGQIFFTASGLPNYNDPHAVVLPAQTPATLNRATATTLVPGFFTTVDVANYDPAGAGAIVAVGGGANTSTVQTVYAVKANNVSNQINLQYGQTAYASLAAARAAIGTGTVITNQAFVRQALIGWIVATRTATNLSDPTQAIFVRAAPFAVP